MATLAGNTVASTYPLLLKVDSSGLDGTLRAIQDGDATDSVLYLATDSALISGNGTKLYFFDADGGEHISADNAGNLTIAAGAATDDLITLDSTGYIALNADGDGTVIFEDASLQYGVIENSSSDFVFRAGVQDKDLVFKGNDGGSGITAMTIDISEGGNVGIGTTAPGSLLTVQGDNKGIDIRSADYSNVLIASAGSSGAGLDRGLIALRENGSNKTLLYGDGQATFGSLTMVENTTEAIFRVKKDSDYTELAQNNSGGVLTLQKADASTGAQISSYGNSIFSGGGIGIGDTAPSTQLVLKDGQSDAISDLDTGGIGLRWNGADGTFYGLVAMDSGSRTYNGGFMGFAGLGSASAGERCIVFGTRSGTGDNAASEAMRIQSNGNVSIGTANYDSGRFEVYEDANDQLVFFINATNSLSDNILWIQNTLDSSESSYNFINCQDHDQRRFYIRGDGEVYGDGSSYNSGADYAEYFETKDGKPIDSGTTVKLDEGKIVPCEDGDTPIGVIRPEGSSMTVGNTAWAKWDKKYLSDDYGKAIFEECTWTIWYEDVEGEKEPKKHAYESDRIPSDVTKPDNAKVETHRDDGRKHFRRKLNADYDSSKSYKPRTERDEWQIVGLLGQIPITKGQPMGSGWIKMKDVSDTVEMWMVK